MNHMLKALPAVFLLFALLLTGCSAAAQTEEALPSSAASSAAPSAEAEEPSAQPSEEAEPDAPVDIVIADQDKPVYKLYEDTYYTREESPPDTAKECEQKAAENEGADLSAKIPVYKESEILHLCYPRQHLTGINLLYRDVLAAANSDAVRKMDDCYYLMYDTDTQVRVYLFFDASDGKDDLLPAMGYPLYMAQTLSYEDFQNVQVGDSAEKVQEIDPKVVELWFCWYHNEEEIVATYEGKGDFCFSYHLLTDGLLCFTYAVEEGEVIVSGMEFADDFTIGDIDWVGNEPRGEICYAIDPLDYVVNSSLTE